MRFVDEISARLAGLSGASADDARQSLNEFDVRDIQAVRVAEGGGGGGAPANFLQHATFYGDGNYSTPGYPLSIANDTLTLLDLSAFTVIQAQTWATRGQYGLTLTQAAAQIWDIQVFARFAADAGGTARIAYMNLSSTALSGNEQDGVSPAVHAALANQSGFGLQVGRAWPQDPTSDTLVGVYVYHDKGTALDLEAVQIQVAVAA